MTPLQTSGSYAPRDMVNAPAIKKSLLERSALRGDTPEVRDWLQNHFYRHLVSNFNPGSPALRQVDSLDMVRQLLAPRAVPEWLVLRLQNRRKDSQEGIAPTASGTHAFPGAPRNSPNTTLWWLDPASDTLLQLEQRMVEFLGSRKGTALEGKLMRINCPQALALWAAEHAAMEADKARGWREHQPDAVGSVWQGNLGIFVEFLPASKNLRSEMAYESQMMRHCLGQFSDRHSLEGGYGEHYASASESGKMRLFSFRNGLQPHITISALVQTGGLLQIDQIKGKQNRPPIDRYRPDVLGFLNSLATTEDTPADAAAMGLVRLGDRWHSIGEVHGQADQLRIVSRNPASIRELPTPSPVVQWVVAARDPALLEGLSLSPGVQRALAGRADKGQAA